MAPTNDDLRHMLRHGAPPERVQAAFELALRLGAAVVDELGDADDPGVRRHFLTILASYGEVDAVRAVAEAASGVEAEHAVFLARQLGVTEPSWLAERFRWATDRLRADMVAWDDVAWSEVEDVLESMTEHDRREVRKRAVQRLLTLQGTPDHALQVYACRRPEEADAVLRAWARSDEHLGLLDAVPLFVGAHDVALAALLEAGRRYPLEEVEEVLPRQVDAFDLVVGPVDRARLWRVTEERVAEGHALPASWLVAVSQTMGPPWSADEQRVLAVWRRWAATDVWREHPAAQVLDSCSSADRRR